MIMDLLFKAPANKAKDTCLTYLFERCDPQARFQFKFNDLLFFHKLCYENNFISKKVFLLNIKNLLLNQCIKIECDFDIKELIKPKMRAWQTWRFTEDCSNLVLMQMRSTLMLAELGLQIDSETLFLKIYNYFFKKYKVDILSIGCIAYKQNGNIYHPRYFSEMSYFEEKSRYLVNKDQILHQPYNLSLLNGGGLAGPSPYKFSELLIKHWYSNKIFNLLEESYIKCALDKENLYSFLPFIINLNKHYPNKRLTKDLTNHLFIFNLGRHKAALLALPAKTLSKYIGDNPMVWDEVWQHFINSLDNGYNRTGLYYSDGSYWSEGFMYSKSATINMQVFRFLYTHCDQDIRNTLEEMVLETYYSRNNTSTGFYDTECKRIIKKGKKINCHSSYRGQHLFLKEMRTFLRQEGESFRLSVNKKLTLGPHWKSYNACVRKPLFLRTANKVLPSFKNSF